MAQNLFAACRSDDAGLVVEHVRVSQSVQEKIEQLFLQQANEFLQGITEEVEFSGGWKPDDHELLTIPIPAEAEVFRKCVTGDILACEDNEGRSFVEGKVRALFVGDTHRVLVQRFAPQQVLSRRFSLLLRNNTFNRLEQPAFTVDTHLTCIIVDDRIKFKSFHALRQIIDLFDLYQEATDAGLIEFAAKLTFNRTDIGQFKQNADQTCRKLIYAIARDGVLDRHGAEEIAAAADAVGLTVSVTGGKIDIPENRADLKRLLRFLSDGLFEAPLSGVRYFTNSKRKVTR